MDVVDAFYCVCATITTLGYGGRSLFSTSGGRIFAAVWILVSCVSLALLFLYVAELSIERRLRPLVKCILDFKMQNDDLEARLPDF